jgi:uncharacterized alpha-E superfamily protein
VISRVADHCFWFGRYLERAESTSRLLEATRTLVFDANIPVTQCWQPLVIVSGEYPAFCKRFGAEAAGDGETVQEYMTWGSENTVSLVRSVRAGRESARVIRDVLSLDTWEAINELYHFLEQERTRHLYDDNREEFYRTVRRGTQLTLGLVRSTMLHDRPMSFLWLGAMLERVGQTARILDMHHHTMEREEATHDIVEVALWLSLLRACSGVEAFMKKHQGRVSAQALASFLVFEPSFPRSLLYCLRSAKKLLSDIWPDASAATRKSAARLDALLHRLDSRDTRLEGTSIHDLLTHIVDETACICSDVGTEIQGPPRSPKPSGQTQSAQ